jgi:hypothetical protein
MAFSYDDLLIRQGQRLQGERAAAVAELESGRVNEDVSVCDYAADKILKIDQDYARLEQLAQQHIVRQQMQQPSNQFGLSQDEIEVAHNSFGPIKRNGHYVDLSKDEKERLYAEQKHKHRYMVATGQYSVNQGSVRR